MYAKSLLPALFLFVCAMQLQARSFTVPDEWMSEVFKYSIKNNKEKAQKIIEQFKAFAGHRLFSSAFKQSNRPLNYLNLLSVNLDEDLEAEHLIVLGEEPGHDAVYLLLLVKKEGDQWKGIYTEAINSPFIQVFNTPSPGKIFFLKKEYSRSAPDFINSTRFYRLIKGEVYMTLEVVNLDLTEASSDYILRSITTEVEARDDENLAISYEYKFYQAAEQPQGNAQPGEARKEAPLFQHSEALLYSWDKKQRQFVPVLPGKTLTREKVDFLNSMEKHSDQFILAFSSELKAVLLHGTPSQIEFIRLYLQAAKRRNPALKIENILNDF